MYICVSHSMSFAKKISGRVVVCCVWESWLAVLLCCGLCRYVCMYVCVCLSNGVGVSLSSCLAVSPSTPHDAPAAPISMVVACNVGRLHIIPIHPYPFILLYAFHSQATLPPPQHSQFPTLKKRGSDMHVWGSAVPDSLPCKKHLTQVE